MQGRLPVMLYGLQSPVTAENASHNALKPAGNTTQHESSFSALLCGRF
jgi:hypothetical protein